MSNIFEGQVPERWPRRRPRKHGFRDIHSARDLEMKSVARDREKLLQRRGVKNNTQVFGYVL